MNSRVVDPYSFFTDPDPDPVDPDGGQYVSELSISTGGKYMIFSPPLSLFLPLCLYFSPCLHFFPPRPCN